MKLTKSSVETIPTPQLQQGSYQYLLHYDDLLKGFGVRVNSKGKKAFFVEKRVQGKLHRISLGCFGDTTVESARRQAQNILGQLAIGIDPLAKKRAAKIKAATLRDAFNEYVRVRDSLKPSTVLDYEEVLKQVVPDWLDKPLTSINRDLVSTRHSEFGKSRSKAGANYAMRVLRAVFNFAINQYQGPNGESLILDNPVQRLTSTRAWYRIDRKETVIKAHQLAAWYRGLMELSEYYSSETAALWHDYFLLLLFTGLRHSEADSLLWDNVDLQAKTFKLIDPKNRRNHFLPMSDVVYSIFERRRKVTNSKFAFPSETSKTGHIMEHRKAMWKITQTSSIKFTSGDLRRTFSTVVDSLDISGYALKRLLNHKMKDVTAGYIISDVERLRKPMQQIADFLTKSIKEEDSQSTNPMAL